MSLGTKKLGEQITENTTVTLSEAAARASHVDPEFVDCRGLEAGLGIKRSLAYALYGQGLIGGCSLRRKGTSRGKRLWNVASVRRYLASQMKQAQ